MGPAGARMPEILQDVTAWLGYDNQAVPNHVWMVILFAFGVSGAIFWPTNTEAAAAAVGGLDLLPFWLIGLACGLGQMVTFGLANIYGGTLMARWDWMAKRALATKKKLGGRLDQNYIRLGFMASLIGIPPLWAMVLLSDSFGVNRRKLLTFCVIGRVIRFSVLGLLGNQAATFFA